MPTSRSLRTLGIIPARGGSKGVPRKNIRLVAGKPLIGYSIEAARSARLLTTFVTSTEDAEIAEVARSLGSQVCLRPPELAGDAVPMAPVVQHVLETLEREEGRFDQVLVLQPTAPQRTARDIDAALELLAGSDADSVVSVYQVEDHHPARMYRRDAQGHLAPFDEALQHTLRQELPAVYHRNGAVYACRRELVDTGTLLGPRILPYIMPRARSINIDDELDLLLADLVLRREQGGER